MNLRNKQTYRSVLSLLLGVFCGVLLTACAGMPEKETKMTEAEICNTIVKIIAKYPSKFVEFRRGAKTNNPQQLANIWNAETFFPNTECQIWEWASGLANYSCQWRQSDEESANAIYNKHTPTLSNCLGSEWTATEQITQNGRQTLYRKQGNKAVISLRAFQDSRTLLKPWWTSLVIGDQIQTVKSPTKN